jgi:hypothetical protein
MIIQFPTLTNPDAIQTEAELRQELTRVNQLLFQNFGQLATLTGLCKDLSDHLEALTRMHMAGNTDQITTMLDAFADRRRTFESAKH